MAELALDDDRGHAFASELDGVRVPELLRRDAPSDTSRDGGPAPLSLSGRTGPVFRGTEEPPSVRRSISERGV